jgi:hypothetical protein
VKAWLPQLEEAYPGVEDLKASLARVYGEPRFENLQL